MDGVCLGYNGGGGCLGYNGGGCLSHNEGELSKLLWMGFV